MKIQFNCFLLILFFLCNDVENCFKKAIPFLRRKRTSDRYDYGYLPDIILIALIRYNRARLYSFLWKDSVVSIDWTVWFSRPVIILSCGIGGANRGDIYRLTYHDHLSKFF